MRRVSLYLSLGGRFVKVTIKEAILKLVVFVIQVRAPHEEVPA